MGAGFKFVERTAYIVTDGTVSSQNLKKNTIPNAKKTSAGKEALKKAKDIGEDFKKDATIKKNKIEQKQKSRDNRNKKSNVEISVSTVTNSSSNSFMGMIFNPTPIFKDDSSDRVPITVKTIRPEDVYTLETVEAADKASKKQEKVSASTNTIVGGGGQPNIK